MIIQFIMFSDFIIFALLFSSYKINPFLLQDFCCQLFINGFIIALSSNYQRRLSYSHASPQSCYCRRSTVCVLHSCRQTGCRMITLLGSWNTAQVKLTSVYWFILMTDRNVCLARKAELVVVGVFYHYFIITLSEYYHI